jgi:hypothetical protein
LLNVSAAHLEGEPSAASFEAESQRLSQLVKKIEAALK